MKYCSKCGKEIMDDAVICVNCGCPVENAPAKNTNVAAQNEFGEKSTLATCAMVFAFLFPLAGFILGIVGAVKYKTASYKKRCIAAIIVSVVVWLVFFIIGMVIVQNAASTYRPHSYYSYY